MTNIPLHQNQKPVKHNKLIQKRLKELLDYNPRTGIFIWKETRHNAVKIDQIAGAIDNKGYMRIRLDGKKYRAHRLAWLYMYGYFPENQIDHIDNNRKNNCINNLREASQTCNLRNRGNSRNNKSGIKGVSWHRTTNKWAVQISISGRIRNLGRYLDFTDAVCARLAAEQCLDWKNCDNLSPALQFVNKMLKKEKN